MQISTQKLIILTLLATISATTIDQRIVGGHLVRPGEIPYQVSLRRSYNDYHFCGGALIAPKYVLTAAHCMYYGWGGRLPPQIVSVVMGQLRLATNSSTIARNVTKIIINPGYDKENMINDIAVLELDREIPNDNNLITQIPLNERIIAANTPCLVSGWGVLSHGSFALNEQLLATDVALVGHKECQKRYNVSNIELSPGMLCAVNDQRPADACQGDSGGPLVCEGRLTGVISVGLGCANKKFPGIYSDVRYYLPWIEETIGLKSTTVRAIVFDELVETTVLPTDEVENVTVAVVTTEETQTTLVPVLSTETGVETLQQWIVSNIFSSSALKNVQTLVVIFVVISVLETLLL